ncbi:MAG TPA: O-antigen ligase family protein [Acidimicrobiales bacterium]|nr:O-antigen ligase family protein [Acidimicrobiales bacterium]
MAFALAVLLLGAPLVLLVLRRGSVGVALLLFILYTRLSDLGVHHRSVSAVGTAGLSSVAQVVLLVMTVLVFAGRSYQGGSRSGTARTVWTATALYFAVVLGSSVWAVNEKAAATQGISLLKNLVIAYLIAEVLVSRRSQRLAIWSLLLAGSAMAGLTVLQVATHTYHSSYFGFAQAPVRQIVGKTNSYRSAGPIGDPNFYALVLAVVVPLGLYRVRDERTLLLKQLAAGLVVLILAAIALTYSRGGILTAVAAVVICGLFMRPRLKQIVAVLMVAGVVTLALPHAVVSRVATLNSKGDNSIADRLGSEKVAVEMFLDHPIQGVGANNFTDAYFPYALRLNVPGAANKPHNTYLSIAAETGLLGLVTFGGAMSALLVALWRKRAEARAAADRVLEGIATSVFLSVCTYLIGVFFLPIAYPRYLWVVVGVALAIASSPSTRRSPSDTTDALVVAP